MATSLIQFTQGASVGTAGQALTGSTGTSVSVANNVNTGVASWQIDLVDVPSGSSLSTGTLAHSDNGSTPSASFTPDVAGGCYRVVLYVWTAINRVGTAQDTDIRNFVVLDTRGFASPPSQIWPLPLPSTASGMAGNKPNELNLSGQERGYAGAGTDGLLDQRFNYPVITNVNVSAGTTSHNLSAFVFSNSNSVSFGLNGSTITASVSYPAQTAQTQNVVVPSAGTQTATSGTVIFANSNGMSFGMSNSSVITASYTVPTQTNQTVGLYGLGNTTQNSSTTLDARTLSFNGLGIVTVGYSNGSIQISASTSQSVQTSNVVVPSAGTQTATSGTVIFSNSNGMSFGMSGSSRITASYTVPSLAGLISAINLSAGTTSNNLSAVTFSNSNGLAFGLNGSVVTGSYTVPTQTVQTVGLYGLGNTTQNSSTTLDARTLSFNGLGIVTVGYSNGSIQISATTAAQSNQTEGRYAIGNTVGQSSSSTFDARTMSVSGAGVISVGYSGNALVISANAAGASINFSAGTTSNNLNAITFSNGNNVSFGLNGSTLTGSVATSLTGVNLSAGTTSNNLSAFVFSNSNNVSFGLNGSTITATATVTYPAQTNQSVGLYGLGNTTQNSSTTLDARSLSFNGLGIVTVGYSNGSIQVSATTAVQTVQTSNIVVPTAGTQTATSGTVAFANSNGISFGMSGSSQITASYTVPSVPSQTAQTVGLYALGNTTQNSSTTLDARTLSFNGLGGATVGYSNGSIQISAPQTVAQTVQTVGLYALGNTTQNSSTTFDARTLSFNGLGIVTVGYSNGSIQVSATTAAQTNQTEGRYAIGNTVGQSSSSTFDARTMSISGVGGVSVGYSGNALIISGGAAGGSVNFSAGTTSNNLIAITFSNSNNVSFGLNGSTLTGSVATSLTNINFSAGTTSNNLSALVFSNSNGLAFGLNGSTVTGSYTVPTQTVQTANIVVPSAGTQTATSGTVVFSNSNGISFGMSGSSQITASYTVPSLAGLLTGVNLSAGTTSNNLSAFVFSNSNNVSFGLNGSTVTATATVTYPAQTVQSIGLYALGNTTQNSSTTLDARTLSFNGLGIITAGYSNGSIQISATTAAQTNQTIGLYAVGNSTQNSSTTLDARTLSFNGAGIASVGYSNGSIIVSVAPGAPSPVNFSAGTTSGNLGSIVFSNSNGVSFGLNGSTITASAAGGGQTTAGFYALGNTTQNSSTTLALNSISFNGIGALTVGYSNSSIQLSAPQTSSLVGVGGLVVSTNGSTISVSGPSLTNYEPQALVNTATFGPGQNTWYLEPFEIPANLGGGRINQIHNFSSGSGTAGNFVLTASASYGTGTSGSISNGHTLIKNMALYSLDVGTNSTRLASFWSNSMSFAISRTMSISQAGGTAISVSLGVSMSYVKSIGTNGSYTTTQYTASTSQSTASAAMNTTAVSTFYSSIYNMLNSPGNLLFPVGFNTTIPAGNYWLAIMQSTASATGGTLVSLFATSNMINFTLPTASSYKVWGQTTSVNSQFAPGAGSFGTTSGSPPSTVGFTQINALSTRQYFHFLNSTI